MRLREIVDHIFWHGSDIADLTELKPRHSKLVGKRVVFVATYPEIAVAMTGHWSDDDFEFGRTLSDEDDPDQVPYRMVERHQGLFEKFFSDRVSLYEVDAKGFHENSQIQDFEMISTHPARVLNEQQINDPLDYLKQAKMVKIKFYK